MNIFQKIDRETGQNYYHEGIFGECRPIMKNMKGSGQQEYLVKLLYQALNRLEDLEADNYTLFCLSAMQYALANPEEVLSNALFYRVNFCLDNMIQEEIDE